MAITLSERNELLKLVVLMFDAAPGATYLNELVNIYAATGNNVLATAQILDDIDLYQQLNGPSQTNEEFATKFLTPLGLANDEFATSFILDKLAAGASKGEIAYEALQALNSVTDDALPQYVNARDVLFNKLAVSSYYSVDAGVTETQFSILESVLDGVTADDTTVETAQDEIDAGTRGAAGDTLTLSPQQDTKVGGGAADIINGTFGGDTSTYTPGDNIDGGAGNDLLSLTVTADGAIAPAIVVKNVEFITISNTQNATFDQLLTENDSSLQVMFTNTVAAKESLVTNADTGTVYGISGAGNLTVNYATVSGTADTAKVTVAGTGTTTAARSTINVSNGNAVEAVTIATTGANFLNVVSGTAAKTVTITGDGTNDITLVDAATTITVDASASTGTNTFNAGSTVSTGDVYKGGTGNDTLSFKATTAIGSVTFTGIETVKAEVDVDAVLNLKNSSGLKTLSLSGNDGSLSVTNAAADLATVNFANVGPTGAGKDFELTRAEDAVGPLTLNLGSAATTDAAVDLGNVTLGGLSALTINAVGTSATDKNHIDTITLNDSDSVALTFTAGADGELTVDDISGTSFSDVTVTVGESGYVQVGDEGGSIYGSGSDVGNVSVTVGENATGILEEVGVSGGDIGTVTVTVASGGYGSAYTQNYGIGDVGTATLTVNGESGGGWVGAYAGSGDAGDLVVTVTGDDAYGSGWIGASGYGDDEGAYVGGGSVGNIVLNVTGENASGSAGADAYNYFSGNGSAANIGNITVTIDGDGASGSAYAGAGWGSGGADGGGNVGDITISVTGSGYASASVYAQGGGEDGDDAGEIGNTTVTLDEGASVDLGLVADNAVGTVDIEGADSTAVYISGYAASGAMGAVTATLGHESSFEAYFGEDGGFSGEIGAVTVTTGDESTVEIYLSGENGEYGDVSVTAGADSNVTVDGYGFMAASASYGDVTIAGGESGGTGSASVDLDGLSVGSVDLSAWLQEYSVDLRGIEAGASVVGGAGGGSIFGTNEADDLTGGAGADTIDGGAGADSITAGAGNDSIFGGSDADAINAGAGNDTIDGGAGADAIDGGAGTDTVVYTAAADMTGDSLTNVEIIIGSGENDTIVGSASADTLIGGAGDDSITGAGGVDVLTGGDGNDTFNFSDVDADVDTTAGAVTDTVTDFVAPDLLNFDTAGTVENYFEGAGAASLSALLTAADAKLDGTVKYYFDTFDGNGYLVFDEDGNGYTNVVKLNGVDASEISEASIV